VERDTQVAGGSGGCKTCSEILLLSTLGGRALKVFANVGGLLGAGGLARPEDVREAGREVRWGEANVFRAHADCAAFKNKS
jgi:hypothetical protein